MKYLVPLTALALAPATHAALEAAQSTDTANRSEYSMEETVVTSSRVPMPLRQIGTSVSVITEQEIENKGFNSLFEILRSQAGIAVSNTGGMGKASALRIRGEEGFRTRVYLDGIDISDTTGTQSSPNFEQILSAGIQRVEVLRGPQGLMYGADAGGIVNISTRPAEPGLKGQVSAQGGRFGTSQLAADVSGGNEQVDFAVSATEYETDGFNTRSTDTKLRDDDGYNNRTLHGRLGFNASEKLRFELVARSTDSDSEYDGCMTSDTFAPTDRCTSDYQQDAWLASVNYQEGQFGHRVSYSGNNTERQDYSEKIASFGADGSLEKWAYLGNFVSGDKLRLIYGAEKLTESIDDGSFDHERDQQGYFVEYQGGFADQLFFTAGARYDDNDDFGSYTTYRLSAAYLINLDHGELKFKSAYGTGFRAPSLYEIAYNTGPFAYAPAAEVSLDAEESAGFDLGVVWLSKNGLYLEANYFDQKIEDEIYYDLATYSGYLQDGDKSKSRGLELISEVPLTESLELAANYTYNDTEDAEGSTRVRRPRHLGNLSFNWRALSDDLMLGLHLRVARDTVDINGAKLDNYEVFDLNASYQLLPSLQVFGRIENLLDEGYQEVPTYNTSARALYAGVRYSF
ncbi:TonB-dependent receptor [Parahaliea sp. F7430]|uniref:TonB-dependent receptor n=1 Tax=Sediminihaliea albiluteola TaxID=2758564 RepID=A0A7W2YJH5_9GAMM|nr:TonB-dependent receptor [Sediminihaliea albiluteola]MBA6412639.1 TonB-dependent receptor [Sediminihaliea albiluteola]